MKVGAERNPYEGNTTAISARAKLDEATSSTSAHNRSLHARSAKQLKTTEANSKNCISLKQASPSIAT
jgi:hypothetical protein